MTSSRSDLEEASFPVNSSVQAVGQCYRLPQPEVSASRETPRLTLRYLRTSIYRGPGSRRQHSPHPMTGGGSDWLRPSRACPLSSRTEWRRGLWLAEAYSLSTGGRQTTKGCVPTRRWILDRSTPAWASRPRSLESEGSQSRKFTGKGGRFSHAWHIQTTKILQFAWEHSVTLQYSWTLPCKGVVHTSTPMYWTATAHCLLEMYIKF